MNTPTMQAEQLARALAKYIAERPLQADSRIHWPSFLYCFADAFAQASEQDWLFVLAAFEREGWLTQDYGGQRITQKASRLARLGKLPSMSETHAD